MALPIPLSLLLALAVPQDGGDQAQQELARMARQPGAQAPFAKASRARYAFEHGLTDDGLGLYAELVQLGPATPGLAALEDMAAEALLEDAGGTDDVTRARRLLLDVAARHEDPVLRAKAMATPRALAMLLARERQAAATAADGAEVAVARRNGKANLVRTGRNADREEARPVTDLLRRYAEEALQTHRRELARAALLRGDDDDRRFVYRLAVRFPKGPARTGIVQEVDGRELTGEASRYLATALVQDGPVQLKARQAEVLADLGEPAALPALRATLRAAAAMKKKAPSGGGGSRAYIANVTQTSYVRDFSVEVAQAAAIADPEVDVIQSGTVLDVRVIGIDWTRYIVHLESSLERAIEVLERKAAEKAAAEKAAAPGKTGGDGGS